MRDIPVFDTETGVSTLVLKEIPYKQVAYVLVQSVQPDGLAEHLRECVSFCRMCGAERVFAAGHPELERWPLLCRVIPMELTLTKRPEPEGELRPVTERNVAQWRELYNRRMAPVDNSATLTSRDETELCAGGACFVYDGEKLLGIGWMAGGELKCVASAVPGAGERVLKTLLSGAEGEHVTLEVASTNRRAIRLYEKLGFVPCAQGRSWYTIFEGGK